MNCLHEHTHTRTHTNTHTHIHTHTYTNTHTHTCTHIHLHIHTQTHIHTYTYIHTYMHTYAHVHTRTNAYKVFSGLQSRSCSVVRYVSCSENLPKASTATLSEVTCQSGDFVRNVGDQSDLFLLCFLFVSLSFSFFLSRLSVLFSFSQAFPLSPSFSFSCSVCLSRFFFSSLISDVLNNTNSFTIFKFEEQK